MVTPSTTSPKSSCWVRVLSSMSDSPSSWTLVSVWVWLPFSRSLSSALLPTFWEEGSPTKIDYRKDGTLILTSLLSGGGPSKYLAVSFAKIIGG